MSSNSLSGYAYYVSFIDDYSRKAWIYFLKGKDEVFSKFKEFKVLVENHNKKKIKTLQSDNGDKFTEMLLSMKFQPTTSQNNSTLKMWKSPRFLEPRYSYAQNNSRIP